MIVSHGAVRIGTVAAVVATAVAAVAALASPAAAASAGGHAVDAVDLVTGGESAIAVVALALEILQILAAVVAVLALRSVIGRFEGGAIVRGLVVIEGAVGIVVIARLWHLAAVVAPVEPAPPLVDQGLVVVALFLFAVATADLYRAL